MGRATVTLLLVLACALGCQTRPIPLSAQRGSTVVIPLGWGLGLYGYGGSEYSDPQRGTMVFRLDGASGFELLTRFSTIAAPAPQAFYATNTPNANGQVVSVVDIPVGAPLGTHSLYVARNLNGTDFSFTYGGQLKILPQTVTAGSESITGQSTPREAFSFWLGTGGSWSPIAVADLKRAIPRPEIQIALSTAVWATELTLTYPGNVITVADAAAPIGQRATVWKQSLGTGKVAIGAAGNGGPVSAVSVPFDVNNGTVAILSLAQVAVTVDKATDANGAPVSTTPTLSLQ